jgi:hypothetical protein
MKNMSAHNDAETKISRGNDITRAAALISPISRDNTEKVAINIPLIFSMVWIFKIPPTY